MFPLGLDPATCLLLQMLNLQHTKDKEAVEMQKTIKQLDEETDRLKKECHEMKVTIDQLKTSVKLKTEDLQRVRGKNAGLK